MDAMNVMVDYFGFLDFSENRISFLELHTASD